ncbi:MAG TPA: thioredoxin-like domain-containing protein [Chitinophagaceae bacterium]|nr:thioredoxin-like domain-containing protein [Chitinophagaceae bacterium]
MKRFLRLFFLTFLIGFLNARLMDMLRANDLDINLLLGACSFFVASLLIFYRVESRDPGRLLSTYIILSLSLLLWDIALRLIEGGWHSSVFSLPRLPCELAAIFFAYQLFSKRFIPIAVGFATLALTVFICIRYLNLMAYNYSNYGTTNTSLKIAAPQDWHIVYQNTRLHSDYSKDKYIVLDFWSKSCGVCYKKFPLVDSLYLQYQGRPQVEIIAVLLQSADSAANTKAQKTVSELYHFPVATGDTTAKSVFNILSLPTVIIVHNGDIIYKGDIEEAGDFLPQ